jgi:hypothetical protein
MKFTAWLEQRATKPVKNTGFDPRLPRQTSRAERRWNDLKEKRRKEAEEDKTQN